jgi:hypothetical protein
MAIRRNSGTSSNPAEQASTHAPSSAIGQDYSKEYQTGDEQQIQKQYQVEAESKKEDKIDTGALLPKDMTVKLVRAEAANWETFLQCLYSITLTLFGLFLGSWVSGTNSTNFSNLEITATISFGIISSSLIAVWVILKIKQSKQGIKIPSEILNQLTKESAE